MLSEKPKEVGNISQAFIKTRKLCNVLVKTSLPIPNGMGCQKLWESLEANHLQ